MKGRDFVARWQWSVKKKDTGGGKVSVKSNHGRWIKQYFINLTEVTEKL